MCAIAKIMMFMFLTPLEHADDRRHPLRRVVAPRVLAAHAQNGEHGLLAHEEGVLARVREGYALDILVKLLDELLRRGRVDHRRPPNFLKS
jgi:hypothetical protein